MSNVVVYADVLFQNKWMEKLNSTWKKSRKLTICEVDNAVLLPPKRKDDFTQREYLGGVGVLENSENMRKIVQPKLIPKSGFFRTHNRQGWFGVDGSYDINIDNIKKVELDVIYGGVLIGHFGHFILECLARLWYVVKHPEDKRKIVFFVLDITEKKKWFDNFFKLLGISLDRILYIEEPTIFSHITIPEQSIYSWSYCYQEYFLPYKQIVKNVNLNPPKITSRKKVYLTRTKLDDTTARIIGEEYFEKFYTDQGFYVVSPETLTIEEQLFLVSNADEIACSMGTLAHFMMFMKDDSKIHLLLRTSGDVINPVCLHINICKISCTIVDVSQNIFHAHRVTGRYLVGATKHFCKYAQDQYSITLVPCISPTDFYEYCVEWTKLYRNIGTIKKYPKFLQLSSCDWLNQLSQVLLDECLPDSFMKSCPSSSSSISWKSLNKVGLLNNYMSETLLRRIYNTNKIDNYLILLFDLHISTIGWIKRIPIDDISNNGTNRCIEALKIYTLYSTELDNGLIEVEYSTESNSEWSDYVDMGFVSGIVGQKTPITGFSLRLKGEFAKNYMILYKLFDGKSWTSWGLNGDKISLNSPVYDIALKVIYP